MAEHTKGPWRVDGPNGYINQIGIGPSIGAAYGAGEEVKANARLIAAAPDLLEALENLHANIAEYARINNLGGFDNQDMQQARAAIAKARGE